MKLLLLTLLAVACSADKLAHNQAVPESAQSAGGDEFLISPRSYEQPKYPYKPPNYIIPKPPSNNNYVPPQNNYVPPQNNYVQPQNDNYYPPQNNYVQPQNDHNYPPQNNYVQPQNDHNYPPQNNYIPPQNNYIPPQNNYIPPVNNYVPPVNNYVPPQNNYIPPKNDYVTAAPQADYPLQYPQQPVTPPVPILQSSSIQNIDGSFKYEYLTGDNTYVEQEGHVENAGTDNEIQVVTGSYSYVGPDGKTYKVTYIADGNGFRATGDHLPKPPPIPKAIQASLDKNAAEEAAAAAAAAAAAQQGGGPWAGSQTNYPDNQNYNTFPGQYVPPNNNYNPNYTPQNNQNWQQPFNFKKPY